MEKSNSFYSIQSNQADDRFSTGWVDIQKNTFTNWCNSTLATKHVAVNDLYTDMCDGVTLIHLYELVSGKTIDHSIQQPKVLPHKLQNISLVMKAMNADGVKFVNIEPLDICDGNPKLILAFIWHMILYYQIGMPQPMSSCSSVDTSKIHPKPSLAEVHPATKSIDEKVYKVSPRTLLLRLVNSLLPHVTVVNLTSDWNDGKALAALIEVLSPGSCPSNEQWNDKNPLLNVTTALCLAEVHLGIPVLIEPHHMTAKNVDELSMITYLSSFTKEGGVAEKYFVKKLSEKFPSISNDLSNMTTNWNNGVLLCKILKECHPQALKDGFITDFSNLEPESHFYIQHSISNINNAFHDAKTLLDIQPNISPELFAAKNVPALAVMSYLSPFLQITPRVVEDPTLASDIGIQLTTQDPDHFPDSRISFRIVSLKHQIPTKDLAIKIEKQGHPRIETGFKTSWLNDKECRVDFTPEDAGVYVLGATLQGQPIKNSPFRLEVLSPHFKSSFVRLENFDPVIDSQEGLEFVVHLKRSIGALSCIIEDTTTHKRFTAETLQMSEKSYKVFMKNRLAGNYDMIFQDGHNQRQLHKTQFTCVNPTDQIKLLTPRAVVVNQDQSLSIKIETSTTLMEHLDLKIKPEQSKDLRDRIDHTIKIDTKANIWEAYISKFDKKFNTYIADVYWAGRLLTDKQIKIRVINFDAIKITDDFEQEVLQINQQHEIRVQFSDHTPCSTVEGWVEKLTASGEYARVFDLKFLAISDSYHICGLCLFSAGTYRIRLTLNKCEVDYPRSTIHAVDVTKIKYDIVSYTGNANDAIEIQINIPREAGASDLFYAMEGPYRPLDVTVETQHRDEGLESYLLRCVPEDSGDYKMVLRFGGIDIPGFPKRIRVVENRQINIASIKAETEKLRYFLYQHSNEFSIIVPKNSSKGVLKGFYSLCGSQNGEKCYLNFLLIDEDDGMERYQCKIKPTQHSNIILRLFYNETELHMSPFNIPVIDICSIETDCHLTPTVTVGERYSLCVFIPFEDMKDSLKVSIIPPKGDILFPPVETYHGDKEHFKQWLGKTGTIYQIEFVTKDCGEYVIHVSFINHPIPGFPKILEAQRYEAKPHNIIIKTPKNTEFRVGDLCSIIVDARQTKPGRLEAKIKDPNDANVSYEILPIHSKNDNDKSRVYQVDFNLQEQGVYEVTFFWNDKKISDQPLHFTAISSMPELSMVNNVVIDGYVGETLSVTIDNVGDHLNYLDCTCYDPSENCVKISIQPSPKNDGSCELVVTPLIPGMHKIEVTMFEKQISGSPFYFNVSYPINAQKVKAYGDGLISGVLHQSKGIFYVSTEKAGGGLLQVAIQGPKDGFKMSIQYKEELEEGEPPTVIVDYEPIVCGLYIINILWSGDHIPGSPFKVYNVKSSTDLQQIANGKVPTQFMPFSLKNKNETFTC